jgi:hypothetical protein
MPVQVAPFERESPIPVRQNAVSFSSPRTLLRGYHKTKLTANWCIARCNSRNAVSISSARTMKRFA